MKSSYFFISAYLKTMLISFGCQNRKNYQQLYIYNPLQENNFSSTYSIINFIIIEFKHYWSLKGEARKCIFHYKKKIKMRSSTSQQYENRENMCQIHNSERIAIDLNSTQNGSIKYLCCNCVVEQLNNNRVSTIQQTQARIQEYKALRQEKRTRDIQIKLQQYKIVLEKYIEFKINACSALAKIEDQIKTQITILEEKQSLLKNFQTTSNFQEDVKQLSEFFIN
ncbi:unnamed protein product [Paramecium octaurelia]|uniref:Uncharacterized protein n=1 Tax=Paramecium octaurelia TaxID=43137 RepID=A0A8S1X557_PAROT|nr:unnamed protein product [Paramecium octaurelia]